MDQMQPFKTCTLCSQCWCEVEAFLRDESLRLEGYQASFLNPEKGLFLFTHLIEDCGTTISIRAGRFKEFAPHTGITTRNTGKATCPGHCLSTHDLEPCNAVCDMRWVRDLLPKLQQHTLSSVTRTTLYTPLSTSAVSYPQEEANMLILDWKPSYSVGIEKFDTQHKRLFAIVNKMGEAIDAGETHDELRGIFRELIDYTRIHFRDEEANLMMYEYNDYHTHKQEHDELVAQVVDFALDFCANPDMTYKIVSFLENWIIGHILGTDKGYTSLLQEKDIIDWE